MTFVLAHLSDAHIGPLPPVRKRDLIGKRLTGYLNWRRGRGGAHDMELLARLVADLRAHKPDHIAMTGDILNIGLPAEFPLARAWLETLGPTHDVSFCPGNHDAYVRGSMPHLVSVFAPWTGDSGHGEAQFPYVRRRGMLALIGLSSGVPTPPFIASGRLGREQRAAFEAMLSETGRDGLTRVVMIHHPPDRAGASAARGLTDARAFEGIIARCGAELIVHGHNHRQSVGYLNGPHARVPIVGVASCSSRPGSLRHRAAYHLLRIEGEGRGARIRVQARGLLPGTMEFGDVGSIDLAT